MKICFLTEFFPSDNQLRFTGGVETRTYYVAKTLKEKHRVTVISRPQKFVAVSLSSLWPRVAFILTAFFSALNAPADVIEGTNFVTYFPAFLAAKMKRIPAIAWYPDVLLGKWREHFGFIGLLGELVETIVIRLPWNHIIALSRETKHKLINAGVDPQKITVVYPGVDRPQIEKVTAVKKNHPIICCISRLVTYKRVADLINAFITVHNKIPHSQLVIIGTGPQEQALKQLALNKDISKHVAFKNQLSRTELIKELKTSHLFCLPSIVEGFGLVTLEAIAAGIPFVNADIPINREGTKGGKGGLLFKPQDSLDLAQKIITLLTNQRLYRAKVSEGRKLLSRFSWEKSTAQTLKVYQQVLR